PVPTRRSSDLLRPRLLRRDAVHAGGGLRDLHAGVGEPDSGLGGLRAAALHDARRHDPIGLDVDAGGLQVEPGQAAQVPAHWSPPAVSCGSTAAVRRPSRQARMTCSRPSFLNRTLCVRDRAGAIATPGTWSITPVSGSAYSVVPAAVSSERSCRANGARTLVTNRRSTSLG